MFEGRNGGADHIRGQHRQVEVSQGGEGRDMGPRRRRCRCEERVSPVRSHERGEPGVERSEARGVASGQAEFVTLRKGGNLGATVGTQRRSPAKPARDVNAARRCNAEGGRRVSETEATKPASEVGKEGLVGNRPATGEVRRPGTRAIMQGREAGG